MSARVLWISKRLMLPAEFSALQRLFGEDVVVVQNSDLATKSGKSIAKEFKAGGYLDLVVYGLKVSIVAQIQESWVQPLIPQMISVEYHVAVGNPDSCLFFEDNGQGFGFRFSHFERAVGSMILLEELK